MGKINNVRVILGGLLAGLIIDIGEFVLNGVILQKDFEAAMADLRKPPVGGSAIAVFLALGFLLGIAIVWIYAAIRPRFGPGPKTALCAGSIAWALAYFYPTAGQSQLGIFPNRLLLIGTVWGLVELCIAAVAGAWVYKED
ncbi:MAG TPA: hypothetical protein VNS63_25755 [Blastocatellia bacterium]|nr:hypothetical protein [Blastocatellia bacterium]